MRIIPGNGVVVTAVVYEPDRWAVQAASLGHMTNTNSPASAGVGTRSWGDAGYGVNRMTGRTAPLQAFAGAIMPILRPQARRLGMQAGVSGQPGLPNSGTDAGPAAWLSMGQLGRMGL
jgi:hypothetical protein